MQFYTSAVQELKVHPTSSELPEPVEVLIVFFLDFRSLFYVASIYIMRTMYFTITGKSYINWVNVCSDVLTPYTKWCSRLGNVQCSTLCVMWHFIKPMLWARIQPCMFRFIRQCIFLHLYVSFKWIQGLLSFHRSVWPCSKHSPWWAVTPPTTTTTTATHVLFCFGVVGLGNPDASPFHLWPTLPTWNLGGGSEDWSSRWLDCICKLIASLNLSLYSASLCLMIEWRKL